jgi:hypothetical protein
MILVRRSRPVRLLAAAAVAATLLVACTDADADDAEGTPQGTDEQATSEAAERGSRSTARTPARWSTPNSSSR